MHNCTEPNRDFGSILINRAALYQSIYNINIIWIIHKHFHISKTVNTAMFYVVRVYMQIYKTVCINVNYEN